MYIYKTLVLSLRLISELTLDSNVLQDQCTANIQVLVPLPVPQRTLTRSSVCR